MYSVAHAIIITMLILFEILIFHAKLSDKLKNFNLNIFEATQNNKIIIV